MVVMWLVVIAVVLVAVGVLAAGLLRRPSSDDLHSVRSYHSALGTLEHLSDRVDPSAVAPLGQTDASAEARVTSAPDGDRQSGRGGTGRGGAGPATSRSVPPVPVRGRDDFPDPDAPLVFDDSRPQDRYRSGSSVEGGPAFRSSRAQKLALDSMNHRRRRGTAALVVVVALVLFGALAYAGSRRSSPSTHPTTSSITRATGSAHSSTSVGTSNQGKAPAHQRKTKTTPTTLPSQIVASSSTGSSATFPVGDNSFEITVTASAPCWVQATTISSGSTLWAGTVQAGASQVVRATGPTAVQLGTASVSLAVGTVPVVLPSPFYTPFVATFEPVVAAPTTTAVVTTTVATTTTLG